MDQASSRRLMGRYNPKMILSALTKIEMSSCLVVTPVVKRGRHELQPHAAGC